jgi:hypothetical protein
MEVQIRDSLFVLLVCTPTYKSKSENRTGVVGYEGALITAEVYAKANHRKFIPLLRKGEWNTAAASWLLGKNYLDFRGDPYPEAGYQSLLQTLHARVPGAPPIGARPTRAPSSA